MTRTNAVCLALVLAVLLACGGGGQKLGEGAVGPTEKKRWAREDLQALVKGKTQEQIRQALGDPDEVLPSVRGCNAEGWLYNRLTYQPPAKATDNYVIIGFDRDFQQDISKRVEGASASLFLYPDGALATAEGAFDPVTPELVEKRRKAAAIDADVAVQQKKQHDDAVIAAGEAARQEREKLLKIRGSLLPADKERIDRAIAAAEEMKERRQREGKQK